ncbi:hypothetical protein ACO0E1_13395 [Curtobacterium sp. RRHDQ66]|uniref:hypothetical protein n=1 Tax=Curtobacterium guangdongense TaxID=3413380 RepID=UPI003BF43110
MATNASVLAEVLGEAPTDLAVWRATRRRQDARGLLEEYLERRVAVESEPVPQTPPGFFRPAFLTDFAGGSSGPYDREFAFVGRALGYADQVAVVDDAERWISADDRQAHLDNLGFGSRAVTDGTWLLRRVARYAPLEESGTLVYVSPPTFPDRSTVERSLPDPLPDELVQLVVDRAGYRPNASALLTDIVRADLATWFRELRALLDFGAEASGAVDLYLPDWFAGPELLSWMFREIDWPNWLDGSVAHQESLTQLLSLPAPSAEQVRRISTEQLLAVREQDRMHRWREEFSGILREYGAADSLRERLEFRDLLRARAGELGVAVRDHPLLGRDLRSTIEAGVAVAPTALLTGQPVVSTVAVAAAPFVASAARSIASWLLGRNGSRSGGDEIVIDAAAQGSAIRGFLNDPVQPGARRRPPSSSMTDMFGRPVAFDFFDLDDRD